LENNNLSTNGNGARAAFWMKIASWTFGLWAIGVPLTAAFITATVRDMQREQRALQEKFIEFKEKEASQYAVLSERQGVLMRQVEIISKDHQHYFYEKMQEMNTSKK
jgi:hypothetical protein